MTISYIDYANAVREARGRFGPKATLICRLSAENFENIQRGGTDLGRYVRQPGSPWPEVPYGEEAVIFQIMPKDGLAFAVLDNDPPLGDI